MWHSTETRSLCAPTPPASWPHSSLEVHFSDAQLGLSVAIAERRGMYLSEPHISSMYVRMSIVGTYVSLFTDQSGRIVLRSTGTVCYRKCNMRPDVIDTTQERAKITQDNEALRIVASDALRDASRNEIGMTQDDTR